MQRRSRIRQSGRRADLGARWRRHARRARRGVSDVIATILLLALTVVLFSAIFAFVTRFPAPPAQSVNQFQASLVQSGSTITGLRILQSGGPNVNPGDKIYLVSSKVVTNWQFSQSSGIPVAWGTGNSTSGWVTGQYWSTTFNPTIAGPANVTIYIVSSTNLLYTTTVPGVTPAEPPVVVSTYTNPTTPTIGQAFTIYALISGSSSSLTVNISVAQIPGLTSLKTPQAMTATSNDLWYYAVAASKTTTNGTYLAFIQGVNTKTEVKFSGDAKVTIGSGSGGGGGGGGLTVTVGMSITGAQPPPATPTTAVYFWAGVTYSGTGTGDINVTFYVNGSSPTANSVFSCKVFGSAALTPITGPGTVTIYSARAFPLAKSTECSDAPPTTGGQWLLFNAVDKIQALAVASAGISGTGVGTTSFSAGGSGAVCATTSTTSCTTGVETSFNYYRSTTDYCSTTHQTSNNCPYLVVAVTNPSANSMTFTATIWANITANGETSPFSVASTTVAAGTTAGAAATLANTRWEPSKAATNLVITAWIVVSQGGTITGYAYATFTITSLT